MQKKFRCYLDQPQLYDFDNNVIVKSLNKKFRKGQRSLIRNETYKK